MQVRVFTLSKTRERCAVYTHNIVGTMKRRLNGCGMASAGIPASHCTFRAEVSGLCLYIYMRTSARARAQQNKKIGAREGGEKGRYNRKSESQQNAHSLLVYCSIWVLFCARTPNYSRSFLHALVMNWSCRLSRGETKYCCLYVQSTL